MQVGRMGLVIAANSWDPAKGSSFPSWAHDAIRWELQKYDKVGSATRHGLRAEQVKEIRAAVARGEDPPSAKQLGVQPSDLALVLEPPEQFTEIRDHGACDLAMPVTALAIKDLSEQDQRLVADLIEGYTPNQIGKRMGQTVAWVNTAIERIRRELSFT